MIIGQDDDCHRADGKRDSAKKFSRAMAIAIHEPMPGNITVVSPTVIASDATTKNQPPDMDIMVFQIRPGAREWHFEAPEAQPW